MQTIRRKLERIIATEVRYYLEPSIQMTDWIPLNELNQSDIITSLPYKWEAEFKGNLYRLIGRL
jgi:hypothetical protein